MQNHLSIKCPEDVIDGSSFTKEKRQEMFGVQRGASSRLHEVYVRKQIIAGTGQQCLTTQTRINWREKQIENISHPMMYANGYDYTENFDGKQLFSDKEVFINLKSVVGTGGSQTRTLRDECYKFVDAQLNYINSKKPTSQYFANIFDGDEASKRMKHFNYLLNCPEFAEAKKYIYVGDLKGYFSWISGIVCPPGVAE